MDDFSLFLMAVWMKSYLGYAEQGYLLSVPQMDEDYQDGGVIDRAERLTVDYISPEMLMTARQL